LFDVIGGDPGREIAKKNGKAHSVDILLRRMDVRHFKGEDSDLPTRWYQEPARIANRR
jgi:hypothetical protein